MKRSFPGRTTAGATTKRKVTRTVNALTSAAAAAQKLSVLSVLTYNVDGLGIDIEHRTKHCINIILEQRADVVCLQEVIPGTKYMFIAGLREHYVNRSFVDSHVEAAGYYTMIFTKKGISYTGGQRLPFKVGQSCMGRDILVAKIEVAGREVVVVTSHLESTKQLPFPTVRCKQLKEICDSFLLGTSSPALFCGDTNLSFNQQYKKQDDVVALGESKNALDDAYFASGAEKEYHST